MIAVGGPAVLSILAIVLFFGAAITIAVLANRNFERPNARRKERP